jgi:hypothetical protein
VKLLGYIAFAAFAALFAGLFALGIYATLTDEDKDEPAFAARKAECRKLVHHLIEMSPEAAGKSAEELAAKIPVEDIELCAASYPEAVACMQGAADLPAARACVPVAVECKDDKAEVTGDRPIYDVGECKTVRVTGNKLTAIGKSAETLEVTGSDNTIRIAKTKTVTDQGQRNTIVH